MDRTEQYRKIILLWVKPELIQQCLVDVNHSWGNGLFSYVRCADYLKDDRLFAVQVQMTDSYPFIEEEWKKKWNHDWVSQPTRNIVALDHCDLCASVGDPADHKKGEGLGFAACRTQDISKEGDK